MPKAAIAIPKNTYAAWTKPSKTAGGNGKKVPKILVKINPPKNQRIGNFLGACVWSCVLSFTSLLWYQYPIIKATGAKSKHVIIS